MSQMSDFMRQQFKAGDDVRDAGLTTPPDIRRYDDIVYGPDSQIQKLDVYRPVEAGENKLPVIVSVHGGGWVYGDKERYQYYCMHPAQMGFPSSTSPIGWLRNLNSRRRLKIPIWLWNGF